MRFAVRLLALLALILAPVSGAHAIPHLAAADGFHAGPHLVVASGGVSGHDAHHFDGDHATGDQSAGEQPADNLPDTTDCMSAPCAATGMIPADSAVPGGDPQERLPLAAPTGRLGRSVAPPFDPPRTAG